MMNLNTLLTLKDTTELKQLTQNKLSFQTPNILICPKNKEVIFSS